MKTILLSLLITFIYGCSPLPENTLYITSVPNEVVKIKLSSIFSSNDYHNITAFPKLDTLRIVSPIELVEKVEPSLSFDPEFVAFKLYKTTTSQLPIHKMGILTSYEGDYGFSYNSKLYNSLPEIDVIISKISKPGSTCFDLAVLVNGFIVDCKDEVEDYFIFISGTSTTNYIPITKSQYDQRKLDQIDNYIYRSTLNTLELYEYSGVEITLLKILDQVLLRTILKRQDFQLLIRDFKTHTNGQISILNAGGEIIVMQFSNNQWTLIQCINTDKQAFAYDLDIETMTYAIIQDLNVYYKSITTQEYTVDLPYDAFNKVYVTANYIIVHQKQSLTLYWQSLSIIDVLPVENVKVFVTKQDGFLLLRDSDKTLSKYALSDAPYLQARFDIVIENYMTLTLKQMANPLNCQVFVLYKVVEANSTEVFYSEKPSSLFTQGVFNKYQEVAIRNIFYGPNLKYQFAQDELLNITVNQFELVTFTSLDTNAIYRKALYASAIFNNIYVVQQDEVFRIRIYTCDTNSKTSSSCQSLILSTTLPFLLKDTSSQLWWLNYDSLFFAISQSNKVDIYYLNYKGQSFQILQSLDMLGDVKAIVTDGYFLFVLVDQVVHMYAINTQDKAKKIATFQGADQIFATQNKDGHLFILKDRILYLYVFSEKQQTLIWQGEFTFDTINVVIFSNYFSVLTNVKKIGYKGFVYNYQNEINIFVEKELCFYEYSSIDLSSIQQNLMNSLMFIKAISRWTFKDVILVYDMKTVSQNSLFIVLNYTLTTQFTTAANYLLLIDENKNFDKYYLTGNNFGHITVKQDYRQVEHSKTYQRNAQVFNIDKASLYQQPIQLINRGEHIFQTLDKLSLSYENPNCKCVDLGQSWYSGQAQNITMSKSENLTYKKNLEIQGEVLDFSPYITEFDDDYLVQLMENKIVLVKKSDLARAEFPLDKNYNFTNLLYIKAGFIYVEASYYETYYLRIIKCATNSCFLLENKLHFDSKIRKAFVDDNFCFLGINNQIQVYDYKGDFLNLEEYELIQTITSMRFPYYMEIQHMYDNVYHFYSLDLMGQYLEMVMYKISATQSPNYFIISDLRQLISGQGFYVPESMIAGGLFLLPNNHYFELLIVLGYSASYNIKFTFDCINNDLCDVTFSKFSQVFQQYSTWFTLPIETSAYVNANILSWVFLNPKTLQYELFLYDIEDKSSVGPKLTIASLVSPPLPMPPTFYQVMSFVYSYNGQLHLLTSVENTVKLNHYKLLQSPQLCTTLDKLEEDVEFYMSNYDENKTLKLKVNIQKYIPPPPGPDPDPSQERHFPYWVIAPMIIGVAVLGFILYKCYQKQKKHTVQDQNRLLMA